MANVLEELYALGFRPPPAGRSIAPGNASRSVLLARTASNDPDLRIPPSARNVVDTTGAALIEQ